MALVKTPPENLIQFHYVSYACFAPLKVEMGLKIFRHQIRLRRLAYKSFKFFAEMRLVIVASSQR